MCIGRSGNRGNEDRRWKMADEWREDATMIWRAKFYDALTFDLGLA
jgi:hypothetical protein